MFRFDFEGGGRRITERGWRDRRQGENRWRVPRRSCRPTTPTETSDIAGVVRKMRMVGLASFVVALACALATGAAAEGLRFVMVMHGQPPVPFWQVVRNGADAAAGELGVAVEFQATATYDMVRMAGLIEAAVASEPDGLVVTIPDADALRDAIGAAISAGIPVVSMNSGSSTYADLGIRAHVGQPEYEAGLAAGKKMHEAGVSQAVCINQEGGNIAGRQRCRGFTDGLQGDVAELAVADQPDRIRQQVVTYLEQDPDVEGALALGGIAAAPVLAAFQDEGAFERVRLATFDFTPEVLQAIEEGKVAFAVDQQPYLQGYLPIVMLDKYARYGVLPTGIVKTGPVFVTEDDAERVLELSTQSLR